MSLQLSLKQITAECGVAKMKMTTSKSLAMVLSQKGVDCPLCIRDEWMRRVLFTNEQRGEREMNRCIVAAATVMQPLYQTVVGKSHSKGLRVELLLIHIERSQLRGFK